MTLSRSHARIVEAIRQLQREHGRPVSYLEVGVRLGYAQPGTVRPQLEALANLGIVAYDPSTPRSVRVITEQATLGYD